MAISAPGVGSGLDVRGIISELMAIERQPLARLQQQQSSFQARLSAFGQVNSALSKLRDAAAELVKPATFTAGKASVSNALALSASASTSSTPGVFTVQVDQLARSQRMATSGLAEPTVAAGDITITVGSNDPVTVSVGPGATLADMRDAINSADAGVTARLINNGSFNQLVVTGNETGTANAFTLTGSGGLSGFDFDADAGARRSAQDSRVVVDGITVTRGSNTLNDVIEGVTLNLLAVTETEATVTIARDTDVAKKAIQDFVKAYNDLNTLLREQTSFNAETRRAGTLNGDSAIRSIQTQIRNILRNPLEGLEGATALADIGLRFNTDGSIAITESELDTALADPSKNVQSLFAGNGTVTGFAQALETQLKSFLDPDGLLNARTEGVNRSIKALEARREALEFRMTRIEARLTAQFTALDSMLASMNQTSSFLTQQIANLPRPGPQQR